jgi:hypothetical protein
MSATGELRREISADFRTTAGSTNSIGLAFTVNDRDGEDEWGRGLAAIGANGRALVRKKDPENFACVELAE